MILITYLVPLLACVCLGMSAAITFDRPFGYTLAPTFIVTCLLIYVSQLVFGSFEPGFYLLVLIAAAAPILYFSPWHAGRRHHRQLIFTPGLWAFICLYGLCLLLDGGRQLAVWDELAHWGKMVKEMVRLDKFYLEPLSTLISHREYPPFLSLWEWWWCRLTGGFREGLLTVSLHTLLLSFIIPPAAELWPRRLHKTTWPLVIGMCLAAIGLLFCLDPYGIYHTIYTDIIIGVMSAYVLLTISLMQTSWSGRRLTVIALTLTALVLSKQIGLFFACLAMSLWLAMLVMSAKKYSPKSRWLHLWIWLLTGVTLAVNYYWWRHLVTSQGISGQFDLNRISLSLLKEFFTHGSEGYELVKRFATALVTMPLVRLPVRIHCVSFLLLAITTIYCLHLQYRQHLTTGQTWLWSLIVFGGGLAYAVVLFILYCFCFESAEVKSLASLNRYLSSYTTMVALWLLGSWWYWHSQCGHRRLSVNCFCLATIAIFILGTSESGVRILPQGLLHTPWQAQKTLAQQLDQLVAPYKRVLLLYPLPNDLPSSYWQTMTSFYSQSLLFDYLAYESQKLSSESIVHWSQRLSDYDYLVNLADHSLWQEHLATLAATNSAMMGDIYRVEVTEATTSLQLVDRFEAI